MNRKIILIILAVFTTAAIVLFVVSHIVEATFIQPPTFQIIGNLLALGVMLQSAAFNFLLIKNNNINTKKSEDANERADAFRNLQFVASNHTIIDFVDYLTMFKTFSSYVARLKEDLDFKFYLQDESASLSDIKNNFDDYLFLTIRVPIKIVVGSAVSSIEILNLGLEKNKEIYNFVPCSSDSHALLLQSEEGYKEVIFNLIIKKSKNFFSDKVVDLFSKIKLCVRTHSFLGVAVTGCTELYFTNPQKQEKDGASRYKIHSSQFSIMGLPELEDSVASAILRQVDKE